MKSQPTRREFLALGGRAAGVSVLAMNLPLILATGRAAAEAADAGLAFEHLSPAEAQVLSAIADQVFPPDEQPGASDLGAVYFMDGALGGFMAGALPMIQAGCTELDEASMQAAGVGFMELGFEQQTALLELREDTAFFGTAHFLTLAGIFSSPAYGGNRDRLGWAMLGFEPRHAWQPPFGYYDRPDHTEADHDAG
jgi:hypothetical protein